MRSTSNFERPPSIQNRPRAWYLPPTFRKGYRKAPAFLPIAIAGSLGRDNLVSIKVYLARESKINSHWIAQIQHFESGAPRNPQNLSKARTSRSTREPDYNLLDFGALENEKELPLRKNAQVGAILRQKSKGEPENFVSIDI
jgi:hypothetical protein